MTLPDDPFDPTEPGASHGHAHTHGSLATLSRRGHERGATAVLAGARHDVRRHQRRAMVRTGAVAVTALAGTVAVGTRLVHDEPPVTTGTPGRGSLADVSDPVVTGIRIVAHDGYDRIEVDLSGPVPERDDRAAPERLQEPACQGSDDLVDGAAATGPSPAERCRRPTGCRPASAASASAGPTPAPPTWTRWSRSAAPAGTRGSRSSSTTI